ncbi:hypothetical protein RV11_GL003166 [Enterococcus phoeniculicola]|uniref:Uncharacterized protein n=1 Tax=Enterococcus phoeniculicola ATCC BAA-412 TaxID=1158610 RepID=R3W623_9ENTE|nr:hypothetical protein [Enterococcus phoeniculicola]EOL43017.1 hypothetical protein UC3_01994 [Enterococcus phoeniculicola ATCC BAA-412]EOT76625.1 hypothetical protein I589_01582 [Enterococcus phoeniculicola ATCC BAA-412]OJG72195.1 hypothetical protein RV11_GL003166 [Enterococcus phoeniculicola]
MITKGIKIGHELKISHLAKDCAISFVRKYHYSKVIPKLVKYYLGMFDLKDEKPKLLGVFMLGWGTQPLQTIRKIFPNRSFSTKDYLEVGKMCFLPEMNNNRYFGSYALSSLIKWLKKNTNYLFLYTLADGIEGKCGYVYQASNFYYGGSFKTSVYRDKKSGEKIHPRSAKKLLEENANFDDVKKRNWLTHDFCTYKGIEKINGRMFRYIFPLKKVAKKILDESVNFSQNKYPKNNELLFEKRVAYRKYKKINRPKFNRNVNFYNSQKF